MAEWALSVCTESCDRFVFNIRTNFKHEPTEEQIKALLRRELPSEYEYWNDGDEEPVDWELYEVEWIEINE